MIKISTKKNYTAEVKRSRVIDYLFAIFVLLFPMPYLQAEDFPQCVIALQAKAKQQGISDKTITSALGQVQYVPRVIELDRQQPEHMDTFGDYLDRRVTDSRIKQGQELLVRHHDLLDKLSRDFGVPANYLLAFWGLETNFGSYLGKMPILDSLATLACDQRRSEYFTAELMSALKLIDERQIRADKMLGSWAGAVGHTQFMPSAYLEYAIDGDNDGHADLWSSVPDALSSAANFLKNLGWVRNTNWGEEVKLPANFAYQESGIENKLSLLEWSKRQITYPDGRPLSSPLKSTPYNAEEIKAAVVLPSGYTGPAFLIYDNFEVILRWNRSVFYALAIGHLADRINGAPALAISPRMGEPRLTREKIQTLQYTLNTMGFVVGTTDGVVGPATRKAIRDFQQKNSMVADGYPSVAVFNALGIQGI